LSERDDGERRERAPEERAGEPQRPSGTDAADLEQPDEPTGTSADEPPVAEAEEAPPAAPAPATWAGRQRSSPEEEAGEHDDGGAAERDEPLPVDEEVAEGRDAGESEETGSGEDAGPDTAERVVQETVEADTLALGDREAAREAALAGLRARAAQHGTKHPTESVTAPPPKASAAAEAKTDGQPQPAQAPPAQRPPTPAAEQAEDLPRRRGMWPRFVAGSLLIIVAMATATSVSLFFFLNGVLADFRGVPGVQNELTVAHPGDPQTILILGSDERPDGGEVAHSDTTILVRIASDQITLMSIPRDLKVNIPNHGIDKFDVAYTIGGAKKTVKVVKQLTGITEINHVVNVDFTGFADAVNAIGCVYVDVDHHYYHSNAGIVPGSPDYYAEIDIPAGYQRMCGYNALQYVRYRHDDNDLVRSARQQDFLRELRQELPASRIAAQYDSLKKILEKYVTLDIRSWSDLIALTQLILAARSAPVVQVHFPANLGTTYVTASQSAIKEAVAKFEGETPTAIPGESSGGSKSGGGSGGEGGGSRSGGGGSGGSGAPSSPSVIDASASGQDYAARLAATKTKNGKPMLDFPLYYPTKLAADSTFTGDSRAFPIDGPGDDAYRGYKLVAQVPTDGYTAYYGVSGTDWKDPPILDNPDETRTIDGRDYLLSWDGPQLRLIGWKTDKGSYWIDNTLLNALTPGQMFAIAESMQKYTG
jgi:polyisoprenyl-teichoic acid--peptidoglycan teichoic acid transferase